MASDNSTLLYASMAAVALAAAWLLMRPDEPFDEAYGEYEEDYYAGEEDEGYGEEMEEGYGEEMEEGYGEEMEEGYGEEMEGYGEGMEEGFDAQLGGNGMTTSVDLLPRSRPGDLGGGADWTEFAPDAMMGQNFLDARKFVGENTMCGSRRISSLDLRGSIPIPKQTLPWGNSPFGSDARRGVV